MFKGFCLQVPSELIISGLRKKSTSTPLSKLRVNLLKQI